MTKVSDLREALMRLVQGGFVVPDSLVYLLSRDGEQLRSIGNLNYRRSGTKKLVVIERAPEFGETMTVGELLFFCHGADQEAPVKLIADGWGEINAEDLESVHLGPELESLKHDQAEVNYEEISVVLCT